MIKKLLFLMFIGAMPFYAKASLAELLLKMRASDRVLRSKIKEAVYHNSNDLEFVENFSDIQQKAMDELQAKHKRILSWIIKIYSGWPAISWIADDEALSRFAVDGAAYAFQIVRRSNSFEFQQFCLAEMSNLAEKNPKEVNKRHLAELSDLVLSQQCGKQRYGTLGHIDEHGKWVLDFPLERRESADKLRDDLGLPSLNEFERT